MTLLWTVPGAILSLVVLFDIARTLMHATGSGALSSRVMQGGWRLFRGLARRRVLPLDVAGPSLMIMVIVLWALGLTVGWALMYTPHLPEAFEAAQGIPYSKQAGFGTALYYSFVTTSTVGYGDIAAITPGMRALSAAQAVVGFILLTASITWVLSLFPVLTRQRAFAHEVHLMQQVEARSGQDPLLASNDPETILIGLAQRVILAEGDLTHFPASYYFVEQGGRGSLATASRYLLDLAWRGQAADRSLGVRQAATLLRGALDDFAGTLGDLFIPADDDTAAALDAYAADHLADGRAWDVVRPGVGRAVLTRDS